MCFGLASRGSQVAYGASLENWFPNGTMGSNPIPCATSELIVGEIEEVFFIGKAENFQLHIKRQLKDGKI